MNSQLKKPTVKLVGKDGNVFNLLSICVNALNKAKQKQQAKELTEKVFSSGSYHEALGLMCQYCEVH